MTFILKQEGNLCVSVCVDLTFDLQVGHSLGQDRWDDGAPVLLSDAVKQTGSEREAASGDTKVTGDTHYCRLTPNCCVGRGGRGGGVFAVGGGPPF